MQTNIEPTFHKKTQCPYCKYHYTTTKVRSRFVKPLTTDSLFYTTYEDDSCNPLLYHVHVCPDCGYSFNDQFSSSFPPHAKHEIEKNLTSKWSGQDLTGIRNYQDAIRSLKLCIFTAMLKEEKPVVLAGLYLRTLWLYQHLNRPEQEERFMRLAVEQYEKAYIEDRLDQPDMTPLKVLYLIGELYHRLGDQNKALKNFAKVVDKKKASFDPKIVEMARDQWQMIRTETKKDFTML